MNPEPIRPGRRLPWFRRRGQPSPVSTSALNRLVGVLNALVGLRVQRGKTDEVFWSDANVVLQLKDTAASSGGSSPAKWRWATVKEYDSATTYAVDEIVVLSPGNAAVDTDTPAGLYVSLKSSNTSDPQWPPPDADPDDASNWWWLIALYPEPLEIVSCVTGKTYLVQGHEQPEEE